MVLTKEGALIVLDSIETSEQEGGWLGGPLWQMNLASNCTACLATDNCTGVRGKLPLPVPIFNIFLLSTTSLEFWYSSGDVAYRMMEMNRRRAT